VTGRRAHAPGRVNLIGDHTDYTGGLVLPMAIDLGTTVSWSSAPEWSFHTDAEVEPGWERYVTAVADELGLRPGTVEVSTTLPVGAGLSSSAALEVAAALAMGFEGTALDLAQRCRRAEQAASGVPCGIMDQLAVAAGVQGAALLIDCTSLDVTPVPLPDGVDVVVAHSGEARALAGSAYAERRAQCEAAAGVIGPLREATPGDMAALADPVLRARARHVVSENGRVLAFVEALRAGDVPMAGELLTASHVSLRDDFEVSTDALNQVVGRLCFAPGFFGARLTGAGFGGCAVALCEAGAPIPEGLRAWRVRASGGARLLAAG
jgi:galactokinase